MNEISACVGNLLIQVKEREAEEIEDRTHTEIQDYCQKVKRLMPTQRKDLIAIEPEQAQCGRSSPKIIKMR
jgi:hypothetical protein